MQTERTRSGAVLASPPLALVIAREIELLATRRGRLVAFDVELARQALAAGGNGAQPPSNGAAPRPRGRPRREVVPGVPLIQGRSGR